MCRHSIEKIAEISIPLLRACLNHALYYSYEKMVRYGNGNGTALHVTFNMYITWTNLSLSRTIKTLLNVYENDRLAKSL